jgi:two-component system sensor kinase FixL
MRGRSRSERYRTLPFLLAAAAAVVLAVGFAALRYVRQQLVGAAGESLLLAAVDIGTAMDLAVSDRFREVRIAASSWLVRYGEADEVETYLQTLKGADPLYLWLGVTDAAGRIRAATLPMSRGADLGRRPWFRTLRARQEPSAHDASTSIALVVPVSGETGTFEGALVAHIGLGALQQVWLRTVYALRTRFGSWIDWQFMTPDGELIDGDFRRRRAVGLQPALQSTGPTPTARAGYFEETHPDLGVPVVTGFALSPGHQGYPGLGWTVIVRMNKRGILGPVDRVVRDLGVVGVLIMTPLFGLLLWSVRRLRVEWLEAQEATARAQAAEAERRARERQIRAIVETASDAIITTDASGVIASINLAGERMFGYGSGELVGRPLATLVPRLGVMGVEGGVEFVARRQDGTEFPAEIGVGEVPLPDCCLFTAIVRDVSQRRQAEARAREHQAALAHVLRVSSLGEMAAGVAHEINQPLTAIAGYALTGGEEVRSGAATPEETADVLERIESEARRAGAIVRRLRSLVDKAPPHRQPTSLGGTTRNVLRLMGGQLARSGIRVRYEPVPDSLQVSADPLQIEQVLVNVIQNAVDSIRASGRTDGCIWIRSARTGGGQVETAVRDNGEGLAAEVGERIFDAFFTTKPDGLGMGLAISRAIVEAHEGRLWTTPGTDDGVTVHFTLAEHIGRGSDAR